MTPYYQDDNVTLYHGDCVERQMWRNADVLITDPPYGVDFVSSRTTQRRSIANDSDTAVRDEVLASWRGDIVQDRPAAVFGTWKVARPSGVSHVLIWDKSDGVGPGMGDLRAAFGTSHEEIYLIGDWPKRMARRSSVIRTSCAMGNPSGLVARTGHPTPKPVGLMEILVAAAPDGVIADPFAGSGSTLIAARNLGRKAIGVELEERYCELIAKRLDQQCFDFERGVSVSFFDSLTEKAKLAFHAQKFSDLGIIQVLPVKTPDEHPDIASDDDQFEKDMAEIARLGRRCWVNSRSVLSRDWSVWNIEEATPSVNRTLYRRMVTEHNDRGQVSPEIGMLMAINELERTGIEIRNWINQGKTLCDCGCGEPT